MKWISVKDRLPGKTGSGAMYMVFDSSWGAGVAEYTPDGYHNGDGTFRSWGFWTCDPNVTHWMPLPHKPTGNVTTTGEDHG